MEGEDQEPQTLKERYKELDTQFEEVITALKIEGDNQIAEKFQNIRDNMRAFTEEDFKRLEQLEEKWASEHDETNDLDNQ